MNKSSAYSWTKVLAMFCLCSLVLAASFAVAQETTAGIQGNIKDPQGAAVNGASVEVTSPALIGSKKTTTEAGYFRFSNLPPGVYTVTVTAPNFATQKQEGLKLETGVLPTLNFSLKLGANTETIDVSSDAPLVEVAQSKKQATATQEIINALPKGRSFQSMIGFAPGARNEPLQGGYQIDGASNAENAYLIEGQDTGSLRTGLSNSNSVFEFVQEVQIKSSGFEAEYGGALGGVINVIQKRGSNAWHGEVYSYYSGDAFDAGPSQTVRRDPNTALVGRLDQPMQIVTAKKDHYRQVEPGFLLGGPIVKDRIWGFASFAPSYFNQTRTVNFAATAAQPGVHTFPQSRSTYNSFARIDALATKRIRAYGSWQYGYSRVTGITLPNADNVGGETNTSATSSILNFAADRGQVQPNVVFGAGADITLTQNLIATSRFGDFFQNFADRGLPAGTRYIYQASDNGGPGVKADNTTLSLQGQPVPAAFQHGAGFSNIGANAGVNKDAQWRKSFNQDLAYFKKGFGTHNFKFGYALNSVTSDVNTGYNTSQVSVAYATPYTVLASNQGVCAAIRATNTASYGQPGTPNDTKCQGLWGTYNIREFGTIGLASSKNHALYGQDAWNIGHGVTLNLGIRVDKESLPSFKPGLSGIDFGFGQKVAPRLGAAWDMLGNGKLKLYGSYGKFYDIMKYELPRGSFGGDYWHDCVYALDDPDYTKIVPVATGGHYCPATGGASGTTTGRFIENQDFRITSNDPAQGCGVVSCIDPDLKPMSQHEYVVGLDWALTPTIALETRYTRKRLDRTIEDTGITTASGEQFFISNPGEGTDTQPLLGNNVNCPAPCTTASFPNQPKAIRRYDGLEFRLIKRASAKWFGQVSYIYSRETGNYNGLTNSDVGDGGATGQRTSPNVGRAFDEPQMQFDSHGRLIDGPLGTDRPHALKTNGYYRVKWWNMETLLGGSTVWESGTPLSTYMQTAGSAFQFLEGRGEWANITRDATGNFVLGSIEHNKRTPAFSQVDLNFVHEIKVSKTNEAMRAAFEVNIINVLNQRNVLSVSQNILRSGKSSPTFCPAVAPAVCSGAVAPATNVAKVDDYLQLEKGFDYIALNNSAGVVFGTPYGLPNFFQTGRSMRFKFRFTF